MGSAVNFFGGWLREKYIYNGKQSRAMTNQEIRQLFDELRYQKEEETIEFKKAEHNFDSTDLGNYFSALCNETNLKGKRCHNLYQYI